MSASAAGIEQPGSRPGLGSTRRAADPAWVSARDPFAVTSDPSCYVARPASEDALAELEASVRGGRRCTVLSGPPGIGKTMLVRVLAQRLADAACCVYLPYAFLGVEDLCRWVLGLLGREPAARDPERALLEGAREQEARGRALVLILDDASALPPETARALLALCRRAGRALRLVVVPVDDGRAGRVVAALGEGVAEVRFNKPLSPTETTAYVHARLRAADASETVRARFDAATLRGIWRGSCGIPRLVHRFATAALRSDGLDPAGPATGPRLEVDPEGPAGAPPLPGLELDPELDPAASGPVDGAVDRGAGPG